MIATVELTAIEAERVMNHAAIVAADELLANALLTRKDAARMLGVSLATLNLLPVKRAKIGGSTRYRMADLKSYVDSCLE